MAKKISDKSVAHLSSQVDASVLSIKAHNAVTQAKHGDDFDVAASLYNSIGILKGKSPEMLVGIAAVALQRLATFAEGTGLSADLAALDFASDPNFDETVPAEGD